MDKIKSIVNLDEERGKLKQSFASLMHDYLLFEEGMKDETLGKQQVRFGGTKKN